MKAILLGLFSLSLVTSALARENTQVMTALHFDCKDFEGVSLGFDMNFDDRYIYDRMVIRKAPQNGIVTTEAFAKDPGQFPVELANFTLKEIKINGSRSFRIRPGANYTSKIVNKGAEGLGFEYSALITDDPIEKRPYKQFITVQMLNVLEKMVRMDDIKGQIEFLSIDPIRFSAPMVFLSFYMSDYVGKWESLNSMLCQVSSAGK